MINALLMFAKYKYFVLVSLFLLSRIIFINPDPIFFDSPEYLSRLNNPYFIEAITSGHMPLHAGYITLFWPIFQASKFMGLNPSETVVFFQIILSGFTVFVFYKTIKLITDQKIALLSSMVLSALPIFWISNVTIMMEITYISTFIFSFYFLTQYLKNPSRKLFLVFSSLFLGYSLFTHLAALLYLPIFIFVIYWKKKSNTIPVLISLLVGLGIFGVLSGLLVSLSLNIPLLEGNRIFFFGKLQDQAQLSYTLEGSARFLRNFLIPLLRNNTNLIVCLTALSLIGLYKSNRTLFILGILWILPSFIANQWWDSVFFGRHALLTSFGLAFLTAFIIQRRKFLFILTFVYLAITVLPAINLLKQPIPYLELSKEVSKLPKDSLYIESHFARPQIQQLRSLDNTIYVDEPGWEKGKLSSLIKSYLEKSMPVFISSQALSEPYGLYSGPYLHSLSLSYKNEFVLQNIISHFSLKQFKIIKKEDNLIIYQIEAAKTSTYPAVPSLKHHSRRLDYSDPVTKIWFEIDKRL